MRNSLLPVAALAIYALSWTVGADAPNQGRLDALDPRGESLGPCPLKHTDVVVDISGFIARVTLTQQFTNPFNQAIEAVYTFPMSESAAVDAMTMMIGDRRIKGLIKEREEARRIYEQARNAGQAASLLDQERPNIFTQSVANIMPGENVDITISYVEFLDYEDGHYGFSFPMVVGPRYMPASVSDPERIAPPITPEGVRAGHDIALRVNLDAGVAIRDIQSELHDVSVEKTSDATAKVALKSKNEIPNRDFVLTYAVAGKSVEDAILTHASGDKRFFTLILQPPARVAPEAVTPKEMIFVIDKSGSMSGFPIEKAKKAMELCIDQMNPNDTFNLISFAGGTGYCFAEPVANTPANRKKAFEYLRNLEGGGGTEMMGAIRAAVEQPEVLRGENERDRLRIVCFMTDGFIGNDMEILDAIQRNAKSARVFAFGIGNSVNEFLIEGMAREGRGAAEIITLADDGDAAAQRFHERVHSPLLTDIEVDFGELDVRNVYPAADALPDLFSAQPLIITGRYEDAADGYVTLRGRTVNGPFERRIRVELPEREDAHDVLAPLWARARIEALMAEDWLGIQHGRPAGDLKAQITKLGLNYGLLTQFTSFVAVEEKVVNEGGETRTIQVPVEMADGVSYEGIFGSGGGRAAEMGALGVRVQALQSVPASPPMANTFGPSRAKERSARGRILGDTPPALATPPVAAPSTPADNPREELADGTVSSKIHPDLRGLGQKLSNGNYQSGRVKVVNHEVEVFINLADDSEASLAALRELGVTLLSHARSAKTVFARVSVKDLEKIAALSFVRAIDPPRF